MRSSQHKMGCHKDISQDTNESITQKKKKKFLQHKKIIILASPFVSFSLKNILHQ
jgi:hypothetical protein